jgi:hypothetical protein
MSQLLLWRGELAVPTFVLCFIVILRLPPRRALAAIGDAPRHDRDRGGGVKEIDS